MARRILSARVMTDATGQDVVTALNGIASSLVPASANVTFDATGCEVISATSVQGALVQADSAIHNLDASLTQLLKVESYTHSYTANANSNAHWNPVNDDSITISGYTPVGIIAYGTNSANVVPAIVKPVNDAWGITLVNISSTNVSNTFSYSVLYIKTGMYS